jgi:hypothetical protein
MPYDRGGITSGLLLLTIGLIFLAQQWGYGGMHNLWPLILIVLGASRMLFPRDRSIQVGMIAGRRGYRREHPLSGMWLILVGGIFLMSQNHILGIRESWPLFIVAAGLGIVFSGLINRKSGDSNPGGPEAGGGGQLS